MAVDNILQRQCCAEHDMPCPDHDSARGSPGCRRASLYVRSLCGPGSMHVASQDEAEVDRAVTEANVFALASHQYWGTWALLQVRCLHSVNQGMCIYFASVEWCITGPRFTDVFYSYGFHQSIYL